MASATTVAAVTAVAGVVSAGSAMWNSSLQHKAAKAANQDAQDLKALKATQAQDIIGQIEAEDLLYEDDLQMIQKQTALAEGKLQMQTESALEQTGDTLANVVAGTYGGKYEGGAGKRTARKARAAMKEEGLDLLESFEMGQKEVALQNEEAERQAEIRKDQIIGSLEATYMELTGNEIPDATTTTTTNPPSQQGMSDEEIDDLYDEQANTDY